MHYDATILMPLQSLEDEEKAFIYHRIAHRAGLQVLFKIPRKTPKGGSYGKVILERIEDLSEPDFLALVDDLVHDGVVGLTSSDGAQTQADTRLPPLSVQPSELANLRHFASVPEAFADTDLLLIAARLGELDKGLSHFSTAELQAELTAPLTNAAATARRLLQKSPPLFAVENSGGSVRYRLAADGRTRLSTLLSLVPTSAHDPSNTHDHADESQAPKK